MDIRFQCNGPAQWKADVMVVLFCKGERLPDAPCVDAAAPWLAIAPALRDARGDKDELTMLHGHPELNIPRVLAVGLGAREDVDVSAVRKALGSALRRCRADRTLFLDASPATLLDECEEALCDDLNSPVAIARLFDWVRHVNALNDGTLTATAEELATLTTAFDTVLGSLLGLSSAADAAVVPATSENDRLGGVIDMILEVRQKAKAAKDWATSDLIRDRLTALGIRVKDRKDGADWELE